MNDETKEITHTLGYIVEKMATKDDVERLATKDDLLSLRNQMQEGFTSARDEMRDIRQRLDAIETQVGNHAGFTKEIDHLIRRVGVVEKHLGIAQEIAA
jgi:hypothetical protein